MSQISETDAVRLRRLAKRINLITEDLRQIHNDIGLPIDSASALSYLSRAEATILGMLQ